MKTSQKSNEKSKKNSKENLGGSYKFKMAAKYKKPKTRGDKNYNKRNLNMELKIILRLSICVLEI